jgi:UDP-2,3-diacylglucosamine pyrophosphatase LpxH
VGRRPDDEGPFLQGLDRAVDRGASSISLLGDVFQFFIAHPKFETPAIRRFLEAVDRLAARKIPVTYVEGNRDFFLRGSYVEHHFREVVEEDVFTAGGRRFLATHGDLLNESDVPYRFWRALSKSPVARASLHVIPKGLGNRLVWKTEARLYRSNFKHKQRLPLEMLRKFARARFAEGVDTILLGHFHQSWVEESGSHRIEILPAFVDERRWMEIADDGSTSLVALDS